MNTLVQTNEGVMPKDKLKEKYKRRFYDIVFAVGFLCCLVPGAFPSLTTPVSMLMLLCIGLCFFDENFYLYAALFMYMRYKMLVGDTPVYRLYSYLMVLRFAMQIFKTKFRVTYLPAIFIIFLHCIFAVPQVESLRIGLNVIVDCLIIYVVMLKVLSDDNLMRKFLYAFLLGGVASGVYGWVNKDVSVDINISGAGAHTVNRNFGALGDSNFAGLFYSLCILTSLLNKKIPLWNKLIFIGIFLVVQLQTVSLSALLILGVLFAFLIVLKYRAKAAVILFIFAIVAIIGLAALLSIPQFREIDAIAGFIIRIEEKLSYIPRGRWDLLTTDRASIWGEILEFFSNKSIWGKLFGGSSITVHALDTSISKMACHNSYIQCLMNFGILGTLAIYTPFVATFIYRLKLHFSKKDGYDNQDIKMLQMVFAFAFLVFGVSVDFFVDWPFMMFYFI